MKRIITYLKSDIANIINEPPRKIQAWTDFGLVVPDIVPPRGKGFARVYSERNLIEFGMVKIWKDQDMLSLDLIRLVLNGLREAKTDQINADNFYTSSEWGHSKELVALTYGCTEVRFFVTSTKAYEATEGIIARTDPMAPGNKRVHTVIFMGKTKIEALKILG